MYFYNARYYDPWLARFVQADTVVPEPANPQAFNRYTYCLNSPIRYVDPSGMFTDDAIVAYLKSTYGDDWQHYWDQWNVDTDWMDMLHAAQAGDILTMMDKYGLSYYQFRGEGVDVLTGAVQTADIVGSPMNLAPHADLDSLRRWSSAGTSWFRVGIFRMVNGHLTCPGVFPGVDVRLKTYDAFDDATLSLLLALVFGGLAPPGWAGFLLGAAGGAYGSAAIREQYGGLKGDDMLFLSLVVPGESGIAAYSGYIAVREGQVLYSTFSYFLYLDEWYDVEICGGTCP